MSEPNHPPSEPPPESAGPAPGDDGLAQPTQPVAGVPAAEPPATEPAGARPPGARPPVARRRPGPLTVMGPWAPVAGALLGLIAGIVTVLLLAGSARGFPERLSLVLLVLGLSMLGAATPLLADEVRMVRRGARETAGRLLSALTPARWVLLVSAFVLFLAAYVGR
jgi:hypothetical protein